jgi:polar amino acid transport system ATP-binding protein
MRINRLAGVPAHVAEVQGIVRDLAAEGLTMLLATHEMSFAREVANTVCFLHEGVILEQGPPEQIFGAPTEPRTQALLHRIIAAGQL